MRLSRRMIVGGGKGANDVVLNEDAIAGAQLDDQGAHFIEAWVIFFAAGEAARVVNQNHMRTAVAPENATQLFHDGGVDHTARGGAARVVRVEPEKRRFRQRG